ncbi:MAG TPA: hypothetical protein VIN07_04450 [Flavipsychrobacter sp.]
MNRIIPILVILWLTACGDPLNKKPANNPVTDTTNTGLVINGEFPEEETSYTIEPTDTISIGNYTLYFTPTDSILFPPYYSDQKIRDSFWRVFGNSHDAANAVENYLEKKLPEIFTSDDSTLTLRLADGKKLVLLKWDEEEMQGYCFEGYFPEIDYVLLYVQYYEGSAYALVNRKNGFIREIRGMPYFTGNYKSFITVSVDMEANYSFNGIEYYTFTADSVVQQFVLGTTNWGPNNAKWLSGNSVIVGKEDWIANADTFYYRTDYTLMTIMRK